jgi:hypothetical protein
MHCTTQALTSAWEDVRGGTNSSRCCAKGAAPLTMTLTQGANIPMRITQYTLA